MTVDIVYETPGVTTDDEAGIAAGWRPGQLSERGRQDARELGKRRRTDGLNAIFCADLPQVVETVELAFPLRELPLHFDTRLRECDYGRFTGAPVAEIAELRLRHLDEPFPQGQSYRQVVEQVAGFLRDISVAWNGNRVLVVAHASNRWAVEHLIDGRDLAELVTAADEWRPGWSYRLPTDWRRRHFPPAGEQPDFPPAREQPGHPGPG